MGRTIRLRTLGDCAIEVGEVRIGPDSTVLFALLLYLAIERSRPVPRARLRELLWPGIAEEKAWHSLRQLLYRIRKLGVEIESKAGHVRLVGEVEADYEASTRVLSEDGVHADSSVPPHVCFLQAYSPEISSGFAQWTEEKRAVIHGDLRHALAAAVGHFRSRGQWGEMERMARRLLDVDPLNEEGTLCLAEAIALAGGKLQAVAMLDRYIAEVGPDSARKLDLTPSVLRRRIAERLPAAVSQSGEHSPLLGRTDSLRLLRDVLKRIRSGSTASCCVWGPPGIGKTRLVSELSNLALLDGFVIARVDCQPSDRRRPMATLAELVLKLLPLPGSLGCAPESLDLLKRLSSTQRPDGSELSANGPATDHIAGQLRNAVLDLIQAVASESRLIAVIEDVHWADHQSLDVIVDFSQGRAVEGGGFLVTSRCHPGEYGWGEASTKLDALGVEDSQKLARSLIGRTTREDDAAAVELCARLGEGNPLYVIELARHWIATGSLASLPPSLEALLARRLDGLSHHALRTLQAFAMLGRNASVPRLRAFLGYSNGEMFDAVEALSATGLISTSALTPSCTHELVVRAALDRVSQSGLRLLHRLSAEVLEQDAGGVDDPQLTWECARHWQQAGEPERALAYAVKCAAHLLDLGLPQEASELLTISREFCSTTDRLDTVLRALGRALFQARRFPEVLSVANERRLLDGHLGNHREVHHDDELMYLEAQWQADSANYSTAYQRGFECLTASQAPLPHRLEAGLQCLMIAGNCGDEDMAHDVNKALTGLLATFKDDAPPAAAINMVFHTTFGSVDKALVAAEEYLAYARAHGNGPDLVRALLNSAYPIRIAGKPEHAEHLILEALSIAKKARLTRPEFRAHHQLAIHNLVLSRLEAAQLWFERAASADPTTLDRLDAAGVAGTGVEIALARGDIATAVRLLPGVAAWRFDPRVSRASAEAVALQVRVHLAQSDQPVDPDALRLLREFHSRLRGQGSHDTCAYALFASLDAAGEPQKARELLRLYLSNYRRERTPLEPALARYNAGVNRAAR